MRSALTHVLTSQTTVVAAVRRAFLRSDHPSAVPSGRHQHRATPLKRPNRELKRRADVVRAVSLEADDHWPHQHRPKRADGMAEVASPQVEGATTPRLAGHAA